MSERYNTILTFDITIVVRSLGTILYWNITSCYGEDILHFDINSVIILIIRGSMTGGGTFVCYKTLVLETGTTVSIWNSYHLQKGKENEATKPKISRTLNTQSIKSNTRNFTCKSTTTKVWDVYVETHADCTASTICPQCRGQALGVKPRGQDKRSSC